MNEREPKPQPEGQPQGGGINRPPDIASLGSGGVLPPEAGLSLPKERRGFRQPKDKRVDASRRGDVKSEDAAESWIGAADAWLAEHPPATSRSPESQARFDAMEARLAARARRSYELAVARANERVKKGLENGTITRDTDARLAEINALLPPEFQISTVESLRKQWPMQPFEEQIMFWDCPARLFTDYWLMLRGIDPLRTP